jgi:hypothetical protein
MSKAPWEEERKRSPENNGTRMGLWFRSPLDDELLSGIIRIASRKGVPRSAVTRWLAGLGLDAARERGLV